MSRGSRSILCPLSRLTRCQLTGVAHTMCSLCSSGHPVVSVDGSKHRCKMDAGAEARAAPKPTLRPAALRITMTPMRCLISGAHRELAQRTNIQRRSARKLWLRWLHQRPAICCGVPFRSSFSKPFTLDVDISALTWPLSSSTVRLAPRRPSLRPQRICRAACAVTTSAHRRVDSEGHGRVRSVRA